MNSLQMTQPHPANILIMYNIHRENEYLVLWEGFPKENASWVEEKDITETAAK